MEKTVASSPFEKAGGLNPRGCHLGPPAHPEPRFFGERLKTSFRCGLEKKGTFFGVFQASQAQKGTFFRSGPEKGTFLGVFQASQAQSRHSSVVVHMLGCGRPVFQTPRTAANREPNRMRTEPHEPLNRFHPVHANLTEPNRTENPFFGPEDHT